ncbi:hypothetical protein MRB53_041578 [Persea americana]|nr:hypothetical protein MRB53_041578 [Persea americana]
MKSVIYDMPSDTEVRRQEQTPGPSAVSRIDAPHPSRPSLPFLPHPERPKRLYIPRDRMDRFEPLLGSPMHQRRHGPSRPSGAHIDGHMSTLDADDGLSDPFGTRAYAVRDLDLDGQIVGLAVWVRYEADWEGGSSTGANNGVVERTERESELEREQEQKQLEQEQPDQSKHESSDEKEKAKTKKNENIMLALVPEWHKRYMSSRAHYGMSPPPPLLTCTSVSSRSWRGRMWRSCHATCVRHRSLGLCMKGLGLWSGKRSRSGLRSISSGVRECMSRVLWLGRRLKWELDEEGDEKEAQEEV